MSDSEDDDSVSNIDFSVISNSIEVGGHMINQIINGIHYGSAEVRNLLRNECDVILECKICRSLFRSFPNFVAHKRVYCMSRNADKLIDLSIEKLKDREENIVLQPSSEELPNEENQQTDLSPSIIEQLKSGSFKGHSEAYKLYTKAVEKIETQKFQKQVTTVTMTPISGNQNAVSITVSENESDLNDSESTASTSTCQPENNTTCSNTSKDSSLLRNILEKSFPQNIVKNVDEKTQKLLSESKAQENVKSKQEVVQVKKPMLPKELLRPVQSNMGNTDRSVLTELSKQGQCDLKTLKCLICERKMASKKSLWNHMQFSHAEKQLQYPCMFCDKVYRYFFGLTRHIMHQHKKSQKQIAEIRGKLRSMAYRKGEETSEKDKTSPQKNNGESGNVQNIPVQNIPVQKEETGASSSAGVSLYRCQGCKRAFWKKGTYNEHTKRCKWLLPSVPVLGLEGKRLETQDKNETQDSLEDRNEELSHKQTQKQKESPIKDREESGNRASPKPSPKKDEVKKKLTESPSRFINTRHSSAKLLEAKYMRTRFIENRRAIQMQAIRKSLRHREEPMTESGRDKGEKLSPKKSGSCSPNDKSPSKLNSKPSPSKNKDVGNKAEKGDNADILEEKGLSPKKLQNSENRIEKENAGNEKANKNLGQAFDKIGTRSQIKESGSKLETNSNKDEVDSKGTDIIQTRRLGSDLKKVEDSTEKVSERSSRSKVKDRGDANKSNQNLPLNSDNDNNRGNSGERIKTRSAQTSSREPSDERKVTSSSEAQNSQKTRDSSDERRVSRRSQAQNTNNHSPSSSSEKNIKFTNAGAKHNILKISDIESDKSLNTTGSDRHFTRSKDQSDKPVVVQSSAADIEDTDSEKDKNKQSEKVDKLISVSNECSPSSDFEVDNADDASSDSSEIAEDSSSKMILTSSNERSNSSKNIVKMRRFSTDSSRKHIFAIQGKISEGPNIGDEENPNERLQDLEENNRGVQGTTKRDSVESNTENEKTFVGRSRRKQHMTTRQMDEIDGTVTRRQMIDNAKLEVKSGTQQTSLVQTRRLSEVDEKSVGRTELDVDSTKSVVTRMSTGSIKSWTKYSVTKQSESEPHVKESTTYMTTRNQGKKRVKVGMNDESSDSEMESSEKHSMKVGTSSVQSVDLGLKKGSERKDSKQMSPGSSTNIVRKTNSATPTQSNKSPPPNIVSIQEIWVDKQPGRPTEEVKSNKIFVKPSTVLPTQGVERPKHTNRMYVIDSRRSAKPKCLDMNHVTSLMDTCENICLQCDMQFTSLSNLRRHVVRHLGWKRYKCRLCKFSSYNRSECNTHLLRIHKEKLIGVSASSFIIDLNKEATRVRTLKKQQTLQNKQMKEGQDLGSMLQRPRRQVRSQFITRMTTRGTTATTTKSESEKGEKYETRASLKRLENDISPSRPVTRSSEACQFSDVEDDSKSSVSARSSQSERSSRTERKRKRDLDETDSSLDNSLSRDTQDYKTKKIRSKRTDDLDQGNVTESKVRKRSASLDGSYSRQSIESSHDSEDPYDNLTSVSDVENNYGGSMGSPTRSEDAGFTFVRLAPKVTTMIAALEEARASVKKRKGGVKRCMSPGKKVTTQIGKDDETNSKNSSDIMSTKSSECVSRRSRARSLECDQKSRSSVDDNSSDRNTRLSSESSTERKTRSSNEGSTDRKTRSNDDSIERKTRSNDDSSTERKTRSSSAERKTRSNDSSSERKTRSNKDSIERKTRSSDGTILERKTKPIYDSSIERKVKISDDSGSERKTWSGDDTNTDRKTGSNDDTNDKECDQTRDKSHSSGKCTDQHVDGQDLNEVGMAQNECNIRKKSDSAKVSSDVSSNDTGVKGNKIASDQT